MPTRRILAVCNDLDFGEELASALDITGCTLETARVLQAVELEQLRGVLCVIDVNGPIVAALPGFLAALGDTCQVILLHPQSTLALTVELLNASDRVVAVLGTEGMESKQLTALATQVLTGESLTIEKLLAPETALQSHHIGDYFGKAACLGQVLECAAQAGVPRRVQDALEQCCDELVMNALYNAPVDPQGRPMFAQTTTKDRVGLSAGEQVLARFGCDRKMFALSVHDEFGTLERSTILKALHKGLHAIDKVDRKVAGAGLGLFLLANECSAVYFSVVRGISTDILCVFDIGAPRQELRRFGVLEVPGEPSEVASRAAGRAREPLTVRPISRRRRLVLAAVVALVAVATAGIVAVRRATAPSTLGYEVSVMPADSMLMLDGRPLAAGGRVAGLQAGRPYVINASHSGYITERVVIRPSASEHARTVLLQRAHPVLDLDSIPSGATVSIGGKSLGETPLAIHTLAAGTEVEIKLQLAGYEDAVVRTRLPPGSGRARTRQTLVVTQGFASVHFDSTPRGARIVARDTKPSLTPIFTPADLVLSTTEEHRFMLTMPKHAPIELPPFRGAEPQVADLHPAATLMVETARPGTIAVIGTPHCQAMQSPAECPVEPGTYVVEFLAAGQPAARREVHIDADDVTVRF